MSLENVFLVGVKQLGPVGFFFLKAVFHVRKIGGTAWRTAPLWGLNGVGDLPAQPAASACV